MVDNEYGFWANLFGVEILTDLKTAERIHKLDVDIYQKALLKSEQKYQNEMAMKELWEKEFHRALGGVRDLEKFFNLYREVHDCGLEIPDIKHLCVDPRAYDPWNDPVLDPLNTIISDREYVTFSLPKWLDILEVCQRSVKAELPRWIAEVSDCDNFASALSNCVQLAFIKAKQSRQGALAIAHGAKPSGAHAYNMFRTTAGNWYVFEPQNGKLMGKLGEESWDYVTYRVIFIC